MNEKVTIRRLSSKAILLQHSRSPAVLTLVIAVGFFAVWYLAILTQSDEPGFMEAFFLFVPVFAIPYVLWLLQVARGLTFVIDPIGRTITKNSKRVASFEEIEGIQIRKNFSTDAATYRLALVLRDGRKVRLVQTMGKVEIAEIAEEIADVLQVTIEKYVSFFEKFH